MAALAARPTGFVYSPRRHERDASPDIIAGEKQRPSTPLMPLPVANIPGRDIAGTARREQKARCNAALAMLPSRAD